MNHRTVETPYIPLNPKTAKTIYYLKIYIYIFFHRGLHVSNKKQPLVPSKAPLGCKPGKHKLQLGDELSLPAAQVPGSPPGQRAASPKQRRTEPGEPQRFLCIVLGVSLIYIYIYVCSKPFCSHTLCFSLSRANCDRRCKLWHEIFSAVHEALDSMKGPTPLVSSPDLCQDRCHIECRNI